jgi:hypothetical protein
MDLRNCPGPADSSAGHARGFGEGNPTRRADRRRRCFREKTKRNIGSHSVAAALLLSRAYRIQHDYFQFEQEPQPSSKQTYLLSPSLSFDDDRINSVAGGGV